MLDAIETHWMWYADASSWARPVIPLSAVHVSTVLSPLLFRSPGKQPAPVFFTGAAVLTLLAPEVAIPALLLAAVMTTALKSLDAYFLMLAPLLLAFGLIFDREPWPAIAGMVVAIAPVMIGAGRNQAMVLPLQRSRMRVLPVGGPDSEHKL